MPRDTEWMKIEEIWRGENPKKPNQPRNPQPKISTAADEAHSLWWGDKGEAGVACYQDSTC